MPLSLASLKTLHVSSSPKSCCLGLPLSLQSSECGVEYRPLPPSLALLKALRVLKLSQQVLSGTVPAAYSASEAFPALEMLDLSYNKLRGRLPSLPGADKQLNEHPCLTPPCCGAVPARSRNL